MLKLNIQQPLVISCTIQIPPEMLWKLNCSSSSSEPPTLKPKTVAKIIQQTPESDFILRCFQASGGTSSASKDFHKALDDYNANYGTNITDGDLVNLIKSWCSTHGYNEEQSKTGKGTGGRYDNKNLFVYKVPMKTLFKSNPDGRGTVMDGTVTFGDGIDRLYIKLSLEAAGEPIDVVSFHRDSDASKQRNSMEEPKFRKTTKTKQKPDEKNAEEGMLEEQPEKVAAREKYNRGRG